MSLPDTTLPPAAAHLVNGANGSPARLTRALAATRALFVGLGLVGGVWGAHVPSIKSTYGLDEAGLAAILFCGAVGAVLSLFAAGRVIGRLGARRAALIAGLGLAAALGLALLWPSAWALGAATVLFGATMGVFDVAINAEGTALERRGGRPVMGGLHGCFSLGAMAGAALAAALLRAEIAAALQLVALGGAVALIFVLAQAHLLDARPDTPPPGATGEAPRHFVWPRGRLLLIGLLIFAGMLAEGVMYDWCVLYLKQELGVPQDRAALGYAVFAGAMAATRFGGDAMRGRVADARILRASALLAGAAMAALLLVGDAGFALVGYAIVGIGLAPIVPILYTAASRTPGSSSAAGIAAASSIGYSGFLVGPPLIGVIAHQASLTLAMGVVVLATAALAQGARRAGAA